MRTGVGGTKISVSESEKPASNGFFAPIKIFVRQKYDNSKNGGKLCFKEVSLYKKIPRRNYIEKSELFSA